MADKSEVKFEKLALDDPAIKRFTEIWHNSIARRAKGNTSREEGNRIFFNRVLQLLCADKHLRSLRADDCAAFYNERYHTAVSGGDVNYAFRRCGINSPESRQEIFRWAEMAIPAFIKALESRKSEDFDNYLNIQKRCNKFDYKSNIFCLMLYVRHPEIDVGGDFRSFEKFGSTYAKWVRIDIEDYVRNICRTQQGSRRGSESDRKIEELENALRQREMELKDLQEEFDKRLEGNHQEEMLEFFSRLNSDKYGCILDEMMNAYSGIRKLRKDKVQLPLEITGLFRLVENFARFVRDNEINPIMKLGSVQEWRESDFNKDSSEYVSGSPYTSADEVKRVKVISPGWFYKDRDIQIARPRLKECGEDDI